MTFDTTDLGVAATMAEPADAPPAGSAFRVTKHAVFLVMGLLPAARPSLEDVLAGQVGTGASIANLKIHVRSTFGDMLATVLTLGLVVPRSVTFEGVVVPRPAAAPTP